MRQSFVVSEIIDGDDFQIFFFERDFERRPADPAKTIDGNFDTHKIYLKITKSVQFKMKKNS